MFLRLFVKYILFAETTSKLHINQAQYDDHMSNIVSVQRLFPQQHELLGHVLQQTAEGMRYAVASATKMLAADSLRSIWSLQPSSSFSTVFDWT